MRCTLVLLWIVAVAVTIAHALWKLEVIASVARTTPAEPGIVDGIQDSAPGMDETDVECPPRPPLLRQGRSRLTGPDRTVAVSSESGYPRPILATGSALACLQPSSVHRPLSAFGLRLRI